MCVLYQWEAAQKRIDMLLIKVELSWRPCAALQVCTAVHWVNVTGQVERHSNSWPVWYVEDDKAWSYCQSLAHTHISKVTVQGRQPAVWICRYLNLSFSLVHKSSDVIKKFLKKKLFCVFVQPAEKRHVETCSLLTDVSCTGICFSLLSSSLFHLSSSSIKDWNYGTGCILILLVHINDFFCVKFSAICSKLHSKNHSKPPLCALFKYSLTTTYTLKAAPKKNEVSCVIPKTDPVPL